MGTPAFAHRLRSGEVLYCGWSGLSDPLAAEAVARAGFDAVCLDLQHGFLDFEALRGAITAIAAVAVAPAVRVPFGGISEIGRSLDQGAEIVICPMVNTRADAERLARAVKFPPTGERSWAPHRVTMLWEMEPAAFFKHANEAVLALAMIETEESLSNLDEILSVSGIDGVFVGPNDLSISLLGGSRVDHAGEKVWPALERIGERAAAHGKVAGIYANTPDLAPRYRALGYRLIASGSDLGFIRTGAAALREALGAEV